MTLLGLLKKSKRKPQFVTILSEEYELLQRAAWCRGERAEAQKKLKLLNARKINNGL